MEACAKRCYWTYYRLSLLRYHPSVPHYRPSLLPDRSWPTFSIKWCDTTVLMVIAHTIFSSLLFYATAAVSQLYLGSDMMFDMTRRKPETTLSQTWGNFILPRHIGMVWEELALDDAVSYRQWVNGLTAAQLNVIGMVLEDLVERNGEQLIIKRRHCKADLHSKLPNNCNARYSSFGRNQYFLLLFLLFNCYIETQGKALFGWKALWIATT